MIIDAHSHLGDILNYDGGDIIFRTGITKKKVFDPVSIAEFQLHRDIGLNDFLYRLLGRWVTRAERERNFAATLENLGRTLEESGIDYTVCLPIPPYVTFEDLRKAAERDKRVIPFTGVDYTKEHDIARQLEEDAARGARGLKLHPIIQNIPLTSEKTMQAVGAFARFNLPVLFHCGVSSYYDGDERKRENPSYGEIHYAASLVAAYPEVRFIAGHAGLYELDDVIRMLARHENVWVDTSFQSPGKIRRLIRAFGPDRLMFASDWPYGNRPPGLQTVRIACRGDRPLEEKILYRNAASLLGMA
jgi:hypothetical protein